MPDWMKAWYWNGMRSYIPDPKKVAVQVFNNTKDNERRERNNH